MDKVSYQCKNVAETSHTAHNLSKTKLLEWVNESLGLHVKKIESLCSGAEYCHFMNILFPGCLCLKRIKLEATLENEFISNLQELQMAFLAVGCDKDVPIDKLIKGHFQESLEFLQWFKMFFDINLSKTHEPVRKQAAVLSGKNVIRGPAAPSDSIYRPKTVELQLQNVGLQPQNEELQSQNVELKMKIVQLQAEFVELLSQHAAAQLRNAELQSRIEKLQSEIRELESQIRELKEEEKMISEEKQFYWNKLRNIEMCCEHSESLESLPTEEQKMILVQKILEEFVCILFILSAM